MLLGWNQVIHRYLVDNLVDSVDNLCQNKQVIHINPQFSVYKVNNAKKTAFPVRNVDRGKAVLGYCVCLPVSMMDSRTAQAKKKG